MDGIHTPFGELKLTFEYAKLRLTGNLTVDNYDFGGTTASGQANLLMDPKGAYLSASVSVNTPAAGEFAGGLLIGMYRDYPALVQQGAISTVLANAYNKNVPCTFQKDGLTGFLVMGKRDLKPIPDIDKDFKIVALKLRSNAVVDARVFMNMAGNFTFGLGLMAALHVDVLVNSITCTEVSGYGDAQALLQAQFEKGGGLQVDACGSLNVGIGVSQCLPTPMGCSSSACVSIHPTVGGAFMITGNTQTGLTKKVEWGSDCLTITKDCGN
jgi:hypothetical protein